MNRNSQLVEWTETHNLYVKINLCNKQEELFFSYRKKNPQLVQ